MKLHKIVLVSIAFLAALSASTQALAADKRTFLLCDAEGSLAMNIGRNYILSGRKPESIAPYVANDEFATRMAADLAKRVESGELGSYADFATDKLMECSKREGMGLDKPRELIRVCYARVDIPFFVYAAIQEGKSRDQAVKEAMARLANRMVFPSLLFESVADALQEDKSLARARKMMGTVLWSCIFHDEWSADGLHPGAGQAPLKPGSASGTP